MSEVKRPALKNLTVLFLILCLFAMPASAKPLSAKKAKVAAKLMGSQMLFESNQGQTDAQVKYLSRGMGYTLFLTGDEAVLVPAKGDVVRLKIAGANRDAKVAGESKAETITNYFIGNDPTKWQTNVANFERVRYSNIYSGIDLLYYGNQSTLEHDFVVAPNADPKQIKMQVNGAKSLRIEKNGDLIIVTKSGELRMQKPHVYQERAKRDRVEIASKFALVGKNQIGFELGSYDRSKELVIDPVLNYSTYLGGSANTVAKAIAVDSTGAAYITGDTSSTSFPPATATTQGPRGGTSDIFVAKMNAGGSALTYLSIVGGALADTAAGIAVDANGKAHVAGTTLSGAFPTASAQDTTLGTQDGVVFRLSANGASLEYSTFFGGTNSTESLQGIALDATGNIYVVGTTNDQSNQFPDTANAFDRAGSGTDAFLTKLDPTANTSGNLYSGFIGGSGNETGAAIAVVNSSTVIVAANIPDNNFTVAGSPTQSSSGGGQDALIVVVNPTNAASAAASHVASSYLGGSGTDTVTALAVDGSGNIYVAGSTASANFPNTSAIQSSQDTGTEAFVTKLTPALVRSFSTYLGSDGTDIANAIAVDGSNNIYVAGETTSTATQTAAPTQLFGAVNSFDATLGGTKDGFVVKINSANTAFDYATYFGGSGNADIIRGLAVDSNGAVYITGETDSNDLNFTASALQTAQVAAVTNAFVAKLAANANATTLTVTGVSDVTRVGFNTGAGFASTVNYTFTINNTGAVTANGTTFNLPMPQGATPADQLTILSAGASNGGTCTTRVGTTTSTGGVTCVIPTIAAGASATVTLQAQPTAEVECNTAGPCASITISLNAAVASAETGSNATSGNVNVDSVPVVDLNITGTAVSNVSANNTYDSTSGTPDTSLDYTITVTNPAGLTNDAMNVTVVSNYPANFNVTGTTPPGAAVCNDDNIAKRVTCTGVDITSGGSVNIVITGNFSAAASATLSNLVTSSNVPDANAGDNTNFDIPVNYLGPTADLAVLAFVASPDPVNVGSTLTYTVTVDNLAGQDATGVTVTVSVPTGFVASNGSLTAAGAALGIAACTQAAAGADVICPGVTLLQADPAVMFTIDGPATLNAAVATANVTNTAEISSTGVSDSNPANNSLDDSFTIQRLTNLSVTAANDADPGATQSEQISGSVAFTVTTSNAATCGGGVDPCSAATNVETVITVPAGFTSISTPAGCVLAGQTLTCTAATLNAGASAVYAFTANAPSSIVTTAAFEDFTTNVSLNTNPAGSVLQDTGNGAAALPIAASTTTRVERRSNLAVGAITANTPLRELNTLTINTPVSNAGPNDAIDVVVTYTFNAPLAPTGISSNNFPGGCILAGNVATCTVGSLANGAGATYQLAVTPNTGIIATTSPDQLTTTDIAISSTKVVDAVPGNDLFTLSATFQRQADLTIPAPGLTAPTTVSSAQNIAYSVPMFNNGPDLATNVQVSLTFTDDVAANLSGMGFVSTSTGACAFRVGFPHILDCNIGTLVVGGTPLTITMTAPAGYLASVGSRALNANAAISGSVVEGVLPNTSGPATTTVERQADLQLIGFGGASFTGTATTSRVGNATYNLVVRNAGPDNAPTDTTVTFSGLPSGYSIVGTGTIDGGNTVNCTVATATTAACAITSGLAGNTTANLSLTITVPAGFLTAGDPSEPFSVAAAIASASLTGTGDPTANNATATSVTTTVQRQTALTLSALTATPTVSLQGPITYQVTVTNNGADDATGVKLDFGLTAGFTVQSFTANGASACTGISPTVTRCDVNGSVAAAGGSVLATLVITADPALVPAGVASSTVSGQVTNVFSSEIVDGAGTKFTGSQTTTVQRQTDLSLSGFTAPASVNATGSVTIPLTITNNGVDAATNASVTFTLQNDVAGPLAFSFVSSTAVSGCTPNPGAGTLTCNAGTIAAAGGSVSFNVVINPPANYPAALLSRPFTTSVAVAAQISNVDGVGGVKALGAQTTTVSRQSDLSLTIPTHTASAGSNPAASSSDITYNITAANGASGDPATGVIVTLTFPTNYILQSNTAPGGCVASTATTVTCTVGNLSVSSTSTFAVVVRAPAGTVANNVASAVYTMSNATVSSTTVTELNPGDETVTNRNTTVERRADLTISVADATDPVGMTANETFTVTVNNAGPDDATFVVASVVLPAGFQADSSTGSCGALPATGTLTCTIGNLATGASTNFTITGTFTNATVPGASALFNTNVSVTTDAGGAVVTNVENTLNNTGTTSTTVERRSNLGISILGAHAGNQSANMTYTVTVNNAGPDPATGVVATINLQNSGPNVFTAQTIGAAGNCTPAAPTTGVLTCNIGSLASGATMNFTIVGTNAIDPNAASALFTSTAAVTSANLVEQNGADNNSSDSRLVQRVADIQITGVTATPQGPPGPDSPAGAVFVVTQHTNLRYDIAITNNGPDAATNVVLTNVLPPQTNFGTADPSCTYSGVTNTVTCAVGTLASGASTSVMITLQPVPPGSSTANITNNPSIASTSISDPNPANNGGLNNTVVQTTQADLGVSVTTPQSIVRVGAAFPADRVTYVVTAANNGPSNATNIVVTDVLPANLTFDAAQSAGFCTALGQTVTCQVGTLGPGTTNVFNIVGIPNLNTALSSTIINNTATITSNTIIDNVSGNNSSANVSHTLRGQADVSLAITSTPNANAAPAGGHVLANDFITYRLTIANVGPHPAEALTVTNTLPPGVTDVSYNSTSFSCSIATNICTLGQLSVTGGNPATIDVTMRVPPGAITGLSTAMPESAFITTFNAPNVATTDTDNAQGNNTGALSPLAFAAADLVVTQSATPLNVLLNPSQFTTYTIRVTNVAGRSTATNVVLTNTFTVAPSAASAVVGNPSGGCNTAAWPTVTCNFASITSGAFAEVTITVDPTLSGLITNTINPTTGLTWSERDPDAPAGDASDFPAPVTVTVQNTPVGNPAPFNPAHPVTGAAITTITTTFTGVSTAGTTTAMVSASAPTVAGYRTGTPAGIYYDMASDAVFNGVNVCINYSETFQKENRVRLFVASNTVPDVDVTTSLDTANNVVCGSGLAMLGGGTVTFVAMEPVNNAPTAVGTATPQQVSGKGVTGTSVRLDTNAIASCTAGSLNCNSDIDVNVCNGNPISAPGTLCGDTLTYLWQGNFTDGTSKTYTCTADAAPTCRQLDVSLPVGSQTLQLTVSDAFGGVATRSVPVTISAINAGGNISAVTVSRGQAATFKVNVTYTGGPINTLTMVGVQGTNLQTAQISCVVTPGSGTNMLTNNPPDNKRELTIVCNTTAPTFASAPRDGSNAIFATAFGLSALPLVGMVLLPGGSRRRRLARVFGMLGLILVLVTFQVACGGGGGGSNFSGAPTQTNAGTPAGAYKIDFATPLPTGFTVDTDINGVNVQTPLTLTVQ